MISIEKEAKAIVVFAFRNNPDFEEIHGEGRISQEEVKRLMKYAVNHIFYLLNLKEKNKDAYDFLIGLLHDFYAKQWDSPGKIDFKIPNPSEYEKLIRMYGESKTDTKNEKR